MIKKKQLLVCLVTIDLLIGFLYFLISTQIMISEVLIYFIPIVFTVVVTIVYRYEEYFSLTLLLFLTAFIFMHGLTVAYFLGIPLESILFTNYMIDFSLEFHSFLEDSYFIFFCYLLIVTVALLVGNKSRMMLQDGCYRTNQKINIWVLVYICTYIGLFVFDLYMALSYIKDSGYLGFYVYNQVKSADPSVFNRMAGYMTTLLPVVFGYSYIFHHSILEKKLLFFTLLISALSLAVIGQRGMLFCLILLGIHLYSKKRNISLVRFLVISCTLMVFAQVLFLMRSENLNIDISLPSLLGSFFHQQGVSFIVYELSKLYSFPDYLAYQIFIPGLNLILDLFNSGGRELQFKFYGDYLAFSVNPDEYAQGKGLGWTLIGDFEQVLGLGNFGVLIGSILLGVMIGCLDKSGYKDIQFIKYSLFLNILFLPRSSLQNLLIPIVVCLFILLIRKLIANISLEKIKV